MRNSVVPFFLLLARKIRCRREDKIFLNGQQQKQSEMALQDTPHAFCTGSRFPTAAAALVQQLPPHTSDGRVDGWMDGWMGGWVDGWVDGWNMASEFV